MLAVVTNWLENTRLDFESAATGATPVPAKLTVWVAGVALSVMVRVPDLTPVAVGVKVTSRVQLPVTDPEQVPICTAKSPVAPMPLTSRVALPVLVIVIGCAPLATPTNWFPKLTVVGDTVTMGTGLAPTPFKAMVWGLPGALSSIVSVPVLVPAAEGVNVTLIVQSVPGPTGGAQLFV